jgi:putative ABC transport system permease protein
MTIIESIRIALRSLGANKLRAALTMLGIIIGVAAVIALMGIGRGAQKSIDSQINSMGTNLIFVSPGSTSSSGVRSAQGSARTLTYDDAVALGTSGLSAVAAVAPQVQSFGQAVYMGNNANTQIVGVTPEYETVRNYHVQSGEFINASNVTAKSTVAVLGSNLVTNLFNGADPIGQTIRINNVGFKVIGVLESKGGSGFGNQDDQIIVPLTTVSSRLQRGNFRGSNLVDQVSVQATDGNQMAAAIQQISDLLRERHHIRFEDDFTVRSQQDLLATANQVTGIFTLFLGGVAGISLLVGGIGIMNIMLVSVTERTREIGIRKAIGATRGNILAQFLTEATVLSVLGGLIGVALGVGIAKAISSLAAGGSFQLTSVVGLDSVLLATLFATAIGLFFGIYPAYRAASLHPIDALRYE